MQGRGKTHCRCFASPSNLKALLYIILFFLPLVEYSKQEEDVSISYEALDSNPDLGSFPEDGELMADSYSEVATYTFVKDEHLGANFLNEGEVGLDELSDCIRARQGKSTLERWMECLNASGSHSMASQDVLSLPTSEIPSVEEENGTEFSNLQQQGKKVDEDLSDSLDSSLSLSGLQHSSAEFRDSTDTRLVEELKNEDIEEQEIRPEIIEPHIQESDHIAGTNESPSVINGSNVDPELPAIEEVERDVSHTENLGSGHRDNLGKVHQGYNIAVCLLTNAQHVALSISSLLLLLKGSSMMNLKKLKMNAQHVALSISSLLLLLKGSSMMNFKKLKMFLALLTEAKQRVAMKIDFKDIEGSAKLSDEQETRESVVSSQNDRLIQALGCPLGMAIATVLAEVLENNNQKEQDILADELAKLMRLAIESSLHPVFDGGHDQFAKDFEASFRSTFKTVRLVKRVCHDKERTPCQSSGKCVSSSCQPGTNNALNGLATDVCVIDPEIECTEALSYKESCMSSMRGKYQVKSDKSGQMEQNSCSPDTVCMKVGVKNPQFELEQEVCSKSSIAMSDLHADLKFSVATINSQHEALKEKWQSARHECLISGMTGIGNVQSNGSSCMNFSKVNTHVENCQTHHLDNDSGAVDSVIEGSNRTGEDVGLQSAHRPNITTRNVSFISTGGSSSTPERVEENDAWYIQRNIHCNKETSSMPETCHRQQVVMHGHAQHDERSQREMIQLIGSRPEAAALSIFSDRSDMPGSQFRQAFLSVLDNSVREQERCNELKSIELMQKIRHFKLKEETLHVNSESNELMRESLDFNILKAMFKKSVFIDQKLNQAYLELSTRCADELAAGLLLMLLALSYGVWSFSRARLLGALASCQSSRKQPHKSSWFYKPMDSLIGPVTWVLQTLQCEVAVVSHMLLGVVAVAIIAYCLLRYRVTSSGQAMPAVIILIVLGALCGWAGKLCVDNLGGSGMHWLVLWEVLCILHAFATCFTSCLFFILNKPASSFFKVNLIPLWIRKFAFHATLLFVLPVMAGLTPFAPVSYWTKHFSNILMENVLEPARVSLQDCIGYFL